MSFLRHVIHKTFFTVQNSLSKTVKKSLSIKVKDAKNEYVSKVSNICFGVAGISIFGLQLSRNIVYCQTGSVTANNTHSEKNNFFMKDLFKYIWPHWKYLLVSIISAIAVAILNIQIPALLGSIVNVLTSFTRNSSENSSEVFWTQILEPTHKILQCYLLQSLMTFTYIYSLSCFGERIACALRQDLFKALVSQNMEFYDKHKTGDLVSRLSSDVQEFKASLKSVISQGLRSLTQCCGCVIALALISPTMTGIMIVIVPSFIAIGTYMGSILRHISNEAQQQVSQAAAVSAECFSNIRTVRGFAMENTQHSAYAKEANAIKDLNESLGLGIAIFQGASNLFLNGIVCSILIYGGSLMVQSQLNAGQIMEFLAATQMIQKSISQLSLLMSSYVKGVSCGGRIFEFMKCIPSIPIQGGRKIPYHTLCGTVEFSNIDFSYPQRPESQIFKNFSLQIPAGTTLALVGKSGGGKSTIAALLERFYDVQGGKITLDGYDIKELDPKWLRGSAIAYIDQEPILFATSILENIRHGRPDATDEEIFEAAKNANANDFISLFPNGYHTILGERGVTISGGQKQRIAIARSLLKNPSIIILDEATSALDAESEKVVQDAFAKLLKNRTVLVIAHRLSTIKNADCIAVLDNGVIAETGTHVELIQRKGIYAELIRMQSSTLKNERFTG